MIMTDYLELEKNTQVILSRIVLEKANTNALSVASSLTLSAHRIPLIEESFGFFVSLLAIFPRAFLFS